MNLFAYEVPNTGETLTTLLSHKNVTINRIVSSDTLKPKRYCQEEDEWFVVLEGEALMRIGDEEKPFCKGESHFLPAHTPHEILATQAGTVWLTVHIA